MTGKTKASKKQEPQTAPATSFPNGYTPPEGSVMVHAPAVEEVRGELKKVEARRSKRGNLYKRLIFSTGETLNMPYEHDLPYGLFAAEDSANGVGETYVAGWNGGDFYCTPASIYDAALASEAEVNLDDEDIDL